MAAENNLFQIQFCFNNFQACKKFTFFSLIIFIQIVMANEYVKAENVDPLTIMDELQKKIKAYHRKDIKLDKEIIKILEEKSQKGDARSTLELWAIYQNRFRVHRFSINLEKVNYYANLSIQQGFNHMHALMGIYYKDGYDDLEIKKDSKLAFKEFLKGAEKRDAQSAMHLCDFLSNDQYSEELKRVIRDIRFEMALKYCKIAATLDPRLASEVLYITGRIFEHPKYKNNRTISCKIFIKSADMGYMYSMIEAARCYKDQVVKSNNNKEKFDEYLKEAYKAGYNPYDY